MTEQPAIIAAAAFNQIKAIAQDGGDLSKRQTLAGDAVRRFEADYEQAVNAPGSLVGRGRNQVDHLRELLETAIGSRFVSGEETSVFQHALYVLNGEA